MEYAIHTRPAAPPDLAAGERALCALDAAAVVDFDPAGPALRVSTWATPGELLAALREAGLATGDQDIEPLPSVCCGGCSFG